MSSRVGEKTEFGPGKTALYYNNNGLFSDPFLEDRLPNIEKYYNNPSTRFLNDYWNIDESNAKKYNDAFQRVMDLWNKLDQNVPKYCSKERQVQNTWIDPIFKILGWEIELEEASSKNGVTNFPDYALFASLDDWKKSKNLSGNNKFKKATAVADAKDWGISLDGKGFSNKNPSFQIINYLKQTDKSWGILTDGKYWRIYSLRSESKHTTFYEIDLEKILASGDYQRFKYFYNFFRVEAFVVDSRLSDRSFLDFVFEDGKFYAQLVDKNLSERVYKVVNSICQGFIKNYPAPTDLELKEIYSNSMYYLFKLMFILNCESKGLLEVNKQDDYYEFSMRKKCLELKEQIESGKNWSSQPRTYNFVNDLFELLKTGDQKIGVHGFGKEPFEIGTKGFFEKNKIGDDYLNAALLDLSCDKDDEGNLQFIDYKILSPDHIGSLFEGLLEFELVRSGKKMDLVNTKGDRKTTGSYYTPDYLVDYIVEGALKSQVENKSPNDILNLKVLDPAMGSGHFLLGVVKYLERKIIEIQNTDARINGAIDFDKIHKEILKNCVFGVDLNPLATQLAKFSLWIYTSKKGESLEPLSNQLIVGDSLIRFDWKKRFAEVFSSGGFDAVVGNPPYVDIIKIEESTKEYLFENYRVASYRTDLYNVFLELSMRVTKPSGLIGMVVNNSYLTSTSMKNLREILVKEKQMLEIVELGGHVFKGVNIEANVLIFKNQFSKKNIFNAILARESTTNINVSGVNSIEQDSLIKIEDFKFEIYQNADERKAMASLLGGDTLADYFTIKQGIRTGDNEKFIADSKINSQYKQLVRGRDINKFSITWGGKWLYYNREELDAPRDEKIFKLKQKIYIRQTGDSIIASMADDKYLPLETLHVLWTDHKDIDLNFVEILLNSDVYNDIYRMKFFEKGKAFAQVKIAHLNTMPFRKISLEEQKQIIDLWRNNKQIKAEEMLKKIFFGNKKAIAS